MNINPEKYYLFIDESGDPSFYAHGNRSIVGTEGFKPLLMIGMLKLTDKKGIRDTIVNFMNNLKEDPLYNSLPCINDPKGWYLHASYDNLEVRTKFTELLRQLDGFKFYCIIGRKRLDIFQRKHNNSESEFYFDLVYHLFKDRLNEHESFYQVFLSARSSSSQNKLKKAIDQALERDNSRRKKPISIGYNSEIVRSKDTPELSIVDYLLWALQRYILTDDHRFYNALKEKYNLILDIYDFGNYKMKGKSTYYNAKNRFELSKAGEFKKDGYV